MLATDLPALATRGAKAGSSESGIRAASRGLDWLNLFVANIQTGFGPFVSVYLTTQGWTQTEIGFALSVGTVTAMASQMPAGALVDAIPSKYAVGFFSILAFTASALLLGIWPVPLGVYGAEILHGFSSCTLGPVIATFSLAIAGPAALGLRLGRNVRFASIGNGVGAILMGLCGYLLPERSVFFLTAALTIPALAALRPIARTVGRAQPEQHSTEPKVSLRRVLANRRLIVFAASAALFTFANNPILPLAAGVLTKLAPENATILVAASIVLPQVIVAVFSPSFGALAESRGRRLVLLLGFAVVPLRALLLASTASPTFMVLVQALDGIAAACFGVMVPLVISDIAGKSGHFNLSLGVVGFAIGIGATLSTTVAGWLSDHFGIPAAFACLALAGLAATAFVWGAMPETRSGS
jgi:MFS family permease